MRFGDWWCAVEARGASRAMVCTAGPAAIQKSERAAEGKLPTWTRVQNEAELMRRFEKAKNWGMIFFPVRMPDWTASNIWERRHDEGRGSLADGH